MDKKNWGAHPEILSAGPRHIYRETMIARALSKYLKKGRILDAGSGSGSLVVQLARMDFSIIGLEIAIGAVRHSISEIEKKHLSNNARILQGSVTKLPFEDDYFDGIVCGEVLEHIEKDTLAVCEFERVLKPDGICIVTVPAGPELWDATDEWAGHVRRYRRGNLCELFKKSGFRIIRANHLGFPIGRVYRAFIFRPLYKKMSKEKFLTQENNLRVMNMLSPFISKIFRFDDIFNWLPFGTNLMLVAMKETHG
jgi:SAM-dependent methyltransferase